MWWKYLARLSRFELIDILSTYISKRTWITETNEEVVQLSFDFKQRDDMSCVQQSFSSRLNAILCQK